MEDIGISKDRINVYEKFQKRIVGFKFNFFLLAKLPSAYFSGVRVKSLNFESCVTSVPYKWFSQNPFKSTYFACQAMAAELSTGLPSIMAIQKISPRVSMLVVHMEGDYTKKAVGLTKFKCNQVKEIIKTVEEAVKTGESKTIRVQSIGLNNDNEEVSNFFFTWSFKQKSS